MKYEYKWRLSFDGGESYGSETYDSLEEAKQHAFDIDPNDDGYCPPVAAECLLRDYIYKIDNETIWEHFEHINEDIAAEFDEETISSRVTENQKDDLTSMIDEAIVAWIKKHNIDTTAPTFAHVKNVTKILS